MRKVYSFLDDLERTGPAYIRDVQRHTLDKRKNTGLAGKYGLYGSDVWWESIKSGRMPIEAIEGVIVRAFEEGQDNTGELNAIHLRSTSGEVVTEPIYVNRLDDIRLFQPGARIKIVKVLETLKDPSLSLRDDGLHPITLEIFIGRPSR